MKPIKPIFMFPGQSSAYPEMIERVLTSTPSVAKPLLLQASEVLGRDLAWHYRAVNPDIFATNRDVQVGVFVANHLHLAALDAAGIGADLSLGLSLGEYNHLVHIGALEFAEALRLVDTRGRTYDAGPDGAMASVFPISEQELAPVVERAREHGSLDIANVNSPWQMVLSGQREALEAALRMLEEEHVVQAVMIEQRIPMHSSRFQPVQSAFRPALQEACWRPTYRLYLPNVLGAPLPSPSRADFIEMLSRHVCEQVRWRDSIDYVVAAYPDAALVEVGPRAVLHNLLQRRWHPVAKFTTDSQTGAVPIQTVAREIARAGSHAS